MKEHKESKDEMNNKKAKIFLNLPTKCSKIAHFMHL